MANHVQYKSNTASRQSPYQLVCGRLRAQGRKCREKGPHKSDWCCPVCGDSGLHLSVKEAPGGNVLLHCFHNCTANAIVAALGLQLADLFADRHMGNRNEEGLTLSAYASAKHFDLAMLQAAGLHDGFDDYGRPCIVIPYRDESANQIALRYRYLLHKSLEARDHDGRFRWKKGTKAKGLLYGRERLAEARVAERAFLFEGESDPHTCWQYGFLAFGVPGADMVNPRRLAKDFASTQRLYVGNERDGGAPTFLRSLAAADGLADRVWVIDLSPYKDPSELHIADPDGFPAAMKRAIASAVPLSEAIAKLTPVSGTGAQVINRRSDMANAQLFVARYGDRFRFAHERKERMEAKGAFHVWDDRRWKLDVDGEIDRLAQQFLREKYVAAAADPDEKIRRWVSASLNESYRIRMLRSAAPMLPIATTADAFDPDPWAFNTLSGIIDLHTCLPRPHDPAAMCSKLAAVEYHVGADCPLFERFLEDVFAGNSELISFVQRCVGYSLTGLTREQVLFLLWGGGWNGKTTLQGMLKRLFGDYSRNADFASFSYQREKQAGTRDDLAALAGARLVTASEPTVGLRFSEGKLKEITGSDPVTARHLYGRHFDFVPQFKLWLSGNHRPTVRDTSEGFWRRICLVPFTVSFKGRADQQLADKLIAELPGILNWGLLGCLEWQRIGLQPPEVVRVATAEYRAEEDLVGTFIAEQTTSDPGAVTPFGMLYESYESWCKDRSEGPVSSKAFGEALSEHGFTKARLGGGKSARQGVRLRQL